MPLSVVLCEGKRDAEVLSAVLLGIDVRPVPAGGKFALAEHVLSLRGSLGSAAVIGIRDRDFDYQLPGSGVGPWTRDNVDLGFYWRAHELENYLLLPELVEVVMAGLHWWPATEYPSRLRDTALRLRFYAAARATLAAVRATLPGRLHDRHHPDGVLPADLSLDACRAWVEQTTSELADRTAASCSGSCAAGILEAKVNELDDEFFAHERYLMELPGSDLARGLTPWLAELKDDENHGELLKRLRTWVRNNRDDALQLVPDWRELAGLVAAA